MTNKFQNKYRIPSARLKNWDYGTNGAYFITICTRNKEHFFGEIVSIDNENQIQLNEIGRLANEFWIAIPEHFPFVELGNFQIMPNHIHGILMIDKKIGLDFVVETLPVETLHCNVSNETDNVEPLHCNVSNEIGNVQTLHCNVSTENEQMSKISPKPGTISTIIRSYKSAVTKQAHFIHADFEWQERFHDHIIRDSESFERIQNYIENNVDNWKEDKFYK